MSYSGDYWRIGGRRISKRRFKRWLYRLISFWIVFLFLGALIILILTGQRY